MYQHPGSQYQQPQQGYNQGQYAAPQQSAQAYGQQPPYQYPQQPYQQQYNQGYQHGLPSQGGPPNHGYGPPQKKKGHPEITRYPPPPGYRGPAAQGGPPQYPGPQGYAQSYPPQSGYGPPQNGYPPPSGYQQAPSYPHQGSPPQNWHQPQHYPAQQGYQYPSQQGYEQSGYQQPHYPGPQGYQGQPSYQDPNHQWQQQPPYPGPTPPYDPNFPPPQNGYNPQQPPYQGPNQSSYQQTGPTPPQSATTNGESKYSQNGFGSQSRAMSVTEDAGWDYDYYGEPWAKDPDTIDPNLSIGIIVWHPANRTSCALPSTFAEAEKEMAEAVKKPDNKKRRLDEQIQESVSKYFVGEDAEEALLNIRQTSEWQIVKDELIFVEFPTSCDLIPLHEVKARRDRPAMEEDPGSEMDLEDGEEPDLPKPEPPPQGDQKHWNVMDNLEQALSSSDYSTGNKSASDTTALTTPAAGPPDQKHVQPLQPVRDTAQEDILAQLGVSGSPKPVYPTPGPAYMPPRQDSPSSQNQPTPAAEEPERATPMDWAHTQGPCDRNLGYGSNQPQGNIAQQQSQHHPPPPPPEPERSPEYDPWKVNDMSIGRQSGAVDGAQDSPGGRSDHSQHTLVGSDFHPEEDRGDDAFNQNSEVRPKLQLERSVSSVSRKRSYQDEDEQDDERRRQHDDVTPRLKRKQPKVDAAYGRRW